jgi:hypothetical protein
MPRRSYVLASLALLVSLQLGGCGDDDPAPAVDGGADAGGDGAGSADAAVMVLPPGCSNPLGAPTTLLCTGLYSDIVSKQLAPGVEPFAPAVPLWSDGADKQRWISLPPGTAIDASNPNEWVFPTGTRVWKEFSVGGKRIETRLWYKVRSNYWVHAVYAWNADETAALASPGGDVPLGAGTYHIPTKDECEKCHRGRTEHILGFEQVGLGLPGAAGLTLEGLVASGRIVPAPAVTTLAIGDDGTGAAAPVLAWLHANCGTTCHNENSNALAYPSGMRLRLDPGLLDGRPVVAFDPLRTTVGVKVNAVNWNGQTRVVPGDPEGSLLYQLVSNRGAGNQMPPIATRVVDEVHTALIKDWIARMAGPPADASVDAAEPSDAAPPDQDAGADPDAPAETPDLAPDADDAAEDVSPGDL